ncbi:HNH endonuclease [Ramlibacter monticola]|uniref:HNH endonuclease n=1 Tax=Ramlibacter monticola TaxID=1926872 RepID=A0A937CQV5_9BURK|nr:HNH endonuclease [Ramlibacter monticola]MBL0390555.1 HNH endonuclease [Ramlibacter monticola]
MTTELTVERLRSLLQYDRETGEFTWTAACSLAAWSGRKAGCTTPLGYVAISVDGRSYRAHRLAWMHVYGAWPKGVIDHIDHNRANNALANLRDVSVVGNNQNVIEPLRRNRSGVLGVSKKRSKWRATIGIDGRSVHIGTFDSQEEAHAAYLAAKRAHHDGNVL